MALGTISAAGDVSRRGLVAGAVVLAGARAAAGQEAPYPSRYLTMVVQYPAGGAVDNAARLVAPALGAELGQSVVVDNRPGAGGNIGTDVAARAAPDGHTLLFANQGPITINPHTFPSLPSNPMTQLAPVSMINKGPLLLVVHKDVPVRTLDELAAYARQRPGELNFAVSSVGGITHVGLELILQRLNLSVTQVTYRGSGATTTDLLGGRLAGMLDGISFLRPHVESGQLRAILVTSQARSPFLPDTPSMAEAGHPELAFESWNGLFAPAGTPRRIIDRLHRAVTTALADVPLRERVAGAGITLAPSASSAEFEAFVRAEFERWGAVVRTAGISVQ